MVGGGNFDIYANFVSQRKKKTVPLSRCVTFRNRNSGYINTPHGGRNRVMKKLQAIKIVCSSIRDNASITSKCNAMQRWVFYMTLQKQNGKISIKHRGERLYNDDEKIILLYLTPSP